MSKVYNIKVTVHSAAKGCSQEFKEGDSWLIENRTPGDMCLAAFGCIYPHIRTMRYGGEHPWGEDKDVIHISCPDPNHCVIYEIRRLR